MSMVPVGVGEEQLFENQCCRVFIYNVFTYLYTIDRHYTYFQFLAIKNNDIMNISV